MSEEGGYGVSREASRERVRCEGMSRVVEAGERFGDLGSLDSATKRPIRRNGGESFTVCASEHERTIPRPARGE